MAPSAQAAERLSLALPVCLGALFWLPTPDRLDLSKLGSIALLVSVFAALRLVRRPRLVVEAVAVGGYALLLVVFAWGMARARVEGLVLAVVVVTLFGLARTSTVRAADIGVWLTLTAFALALLAHAQFVGVDLFNRHLPGFGGRSAVATFGNPDLMGYWLVGALPFALGALGRALRSRSSGWRRGLWVAVVAIVSALVLSGCRGAYLAGAVVGAVALVRLPWRGALSALVAGVLLAGALNAAGGGGLARRVTDPGSAGAGLEGRLYLWRVNLDLIAGAGPLGEGPEAFRRVWPMAQAEVLREQPRWRGYYTDLRHAHLDAAEVATDWGWLGLACAAFALVVIWRRRRDAPAESRWPRTATLSLLVAGLTGPVLFQPATGALLAVSAGLAARGSSPTAAGGRPARVAGALVVVLACGLTAGLLGPRLASEWSRTEALRADQVGQWERAESQYRRAVELDRYNPLAQLTAGWFLTRTGRSEAAIAPLKAACEALPTAFAYQVYAEALRGAGRAETARDAQALADYLRGGSPP